jgi:hypothetical protein
MHGSCLGSGDKPAVISLKAVSRGPGRGYTLRLSADVILYLIKVDLTLFIFLISNAVAVFLRDKEALPLKSERSSPNEMG